MRTFSPNREQVLPVEKLKEYFVSAEDAVARSATRWMERLRSHGPALLAHSVSVAGWTEKFGIRLGMNQHELRELTVAGMLHDVGKLVVPKAVLSKSGFLDSGERTLVQSHAQAGYELLRAEAVHSEVVLEVVRYHHERLDGSGYPSALRGAQIRRQVRIVTLCDIYAALVENRPYNRPMNSEEALQRMAEKSDRLDMALLRVFGEVARAAGANSEGVQSTLRQCPTFPVG